MFTKKWTGNLVGLMHDNQITKTQLAKKLGVTREYVSMILNGHRTPACAKERFEEAVNTIINETETGCTEASGK